MIVHLQWPVPTWQLGTILAHCSPCCLQDINEEVINYSIVLVPDVNDTAKLVRFFFFEISGSVLPGIRCPKTD